jgi:hypothetical protein
MNTINGNACGIYQETLVMTLWADFLNNNKRLIHKWKHYFPIYERHFRRFVNLDVTLIEIGCGAGGSLQMWKRFLGPHATIVGIDNEPQCRAYEEDQISVRIGNQADARFLDEVFTEFGAPDIVIDDGSHRQSDIRASFAALYPRLAKNGIYLVEDLHTAYWPEYGGAFGKTGSFIEDCKALIDLLNAEHTRGALAPTEFTGSTQSIHFYDSVAVFEKGRHAALSLQTGGQ